MSKLEGVHQTLNGVKLIFGVNKILVVGICVDYMDKSHLWRKWMLFKE
jgi:hypothetical protein